MKEGWLLGFKPVPADVVKAIDSQSIDEDAAWILVPNICAPSNSAFYMPDAVNINPQRYLEMMKVGSFKSSLTIKDQSLKVERRDLLLHTVLGSLSVPAIVPLAFAEEDDVNKFKITIPQDWQIGGGEGNGFKSVTTFYPSEASNSNGHLRLPVKHQMLMTFFGITTNPSLNVVAVLRSHLLTSKLLFCSHKLLDHLAPTTVSQPQAFRAFSSLHT